MLKHSTCHIYEYSNNLFHQPVNWPEHRPIRSSLLCVPSILLKSSWSLAIVSFSLFDSCGCVGSGHVNGKTSPWEASKESSAGKVSSCCLWKIKEIMTYKILNVTISILQFWRHTSNMSINYTKGVSCRCSPILLVRRKIFCMSWIQYKGALVKGGDAWIKSLHWKV